ncbi:MAG: DUF4367 domain-containing protein [Muricomes sp.]
MDEKNLFYKLGMEGSIEKLENKNVENFRGQEDLKEQLLSELNNSTVSSKKNYKKKPVKKRVVLAAALVALLALSTTAFAAVRHFIYQDEIGQIGDYKLNIQKSEENTDTENISKYVDVKAGYIPDGYKLATGKAYEGKFVLQKQTEKGDSITILGMTLNEGTINLANITDVEDIMLGDLPAKILTSFSNAGSPRHDIFVFHEEEGYWICVYGVSTNLPLEELKKIAENATGVITKDTKAPYADVNQSDDTNAASKLNITEKNFVNIGDMVQDQQAQDKQTLEFLEQYSSAEEFAKNKVMYSVDSVEISDTLPGDIDLSAGNVSDILTEYMNEDTTLKPVQKSYAELNTSTGKMEVLTDTQNGKYAKVKVTLYNPSDIQINDYSYQARIDVLKKNDKGLWYSAMESSTNDFPTYFNEAVYLSFQDYSGKSAYQTVLKPGEKKTITALYLVDNQNLDSAYLSVNATGFSDGSERCWNNFIKIQ